MLMTEVEAKTKRCTPMAVVWIMDAETRKANEASGALEFNCIGSRCAQWRWAEWADTEPHQPRLGYCGLAGKPE